MSLITNKNVGAYVRLSMDDPLQATSIENQIQLITEYCKANQLVLSKIYSDYGYTGRNFDRPEFKKMLLDLKEGIIDCIVVKDISRFGRTLLGVGRYIEEFFIPQNIRFISITDNFDTKNQQVDESTVIKLFLNDYYVKECSKKLKQTFTRQSKVKSLNKGGFYGYVKDETGKLVPDPMTSPIVKRIFESYISEKSASKVAEVLNDEKIMTPMVYRMSRGLSQGRKLDSSLYIWNKENILDILKRYEYTGAAVNMKRTYEKGKEVILEQNHEPLISKELFEEVKQIRKSLNKKLKKTSSQAYSLQEHFSKFFYCPICGHTYSFQADRGTRFYYVDRHCKVRIKSSIHQILYQICLLAIHKASLNSDAFILKVKEQVLDGKRYKTVLEELEDNQRKTEYQIQQLFESYALGNLTKEAYEVNLQILKDRNSSLTEHKSEMVLYKNKEEEVHHKAVSFLNQVFNLQIKKLSPVTVIKSLMEKVILSTDNSEIIIDEIVYKF